MKQFTLKELYRKIGQALKEMPFQITNHGKVVAVVTKPNKPEEECESEKQPRKQS